jgi:acyl-coenzyme A thioesterase PaaI-like protein
MRIEAAGNSIVSRFRIPEYMAGWRTDTTVGAHPGAIATALVTVMGQGTFYRTKKAAWIKSLSVEYLGLVPVDHELTCESNVMHQRGNEEVVTEATIVDGNGQVLARASASYHLLDLTALGAPHSLISNRVACAPAFAAEFQRLARTLP